MFDLINKLREFEESFQGSWDAYVALHTEFDSYRGKEINDDNVQDINRLIKEIQDAFAALYPALHFISYRAEAAGNAAKNYTTFIDALKAAGATENPPASSPHQIPGSEMAQDGVGFQA